jgi:hypothetical protein
MSAREINSLKIDRNYAVFLGYCERENWVTVAPQSSNNLQFNSKIILLLTWICKPLQICFYFQMSISQGATSTELSTLHWVLSGSSYKHCMCLRWFLPHSVLYLCHATGFIHFQRQETWQDLDHKMNTLCNFHMSTIFPSQSSSTDWLNLLKFQSFCQSQALIWTKYLQNMNKTISHWANPFSLPIFYFCHQVQNSYKHWEVHVNV